jgi:hypothetical protein
MTLPLARHSYAYEVALGDQVPGEACRVRPTLAVPVILGLAVALDAGPLATTAVEAEVVDVAELPVREAVTVTESRFPAWAGAMR